LLLFARLVLGGVVDDAQLAGMGDANSLEQDLAGLLEDRMQVRGTHCAEGIAQGRVCCWKAVVVMVKAKIAIEQESVNMMMAS
jgi:hypothetical protein